LFHQGELGIKLEGRYPLFNNYMLTIPIENGTITERHEDAQRLNTRGVKASNDSIGTR